MCQTVLLIGQPTYRIVKAERSTQAESMASCAAGPGFKPQHQSHDGTFAVPLCGRKDKPHKGAHPFMRGSLPEGLTSSQQVLVNWGGERQDSSHTTWSPLSSLPQPHTVKIVVLSPLYPEDNTPQINGRERERGGACD